MSCCSKCRKHYRELEDEQGDNPCPHCGLYPEERNIGREMNVYEKLEKEGTLDDFLDELATHCSCSETNGGGDCEACMEISRIKTELGK